MRKGFSLLVCLCILLFCTLPFRAHAESASARQLASQCFQCHGTNGQPVVDQDEIGGEDPKSTYEKLIEMKYRGYTKNIMDLHARGYSDAQLREISLHLSQLPKNVPIIPPPDDTPMEPPPDDDEDDDEAKEQDRKNLRAILGEGNYRKLRRKLRSEKRSRIVRKARKLNKMLLSGYQIEQRWLLLIHSYINDRRER